ncbi:MAG: family 65 glycosyl hydrolase [Lachnospiraceae bacterium]|nr:family 65 glycosyl hydrolase [Lachnospiraceae bacterium]
MAKVANIHYLVDPWKIREEGFDGDYSRVGESIFSLGNESIGIRGCFDEGGSVDSLRGAYINGVYDITDIERSYRGIVDKVHFMIPAADWLDTQITVDGEILDLGKVSFRNFTRELDMRTGMLTRSFIWETAGKKELKVCFERFLDMVHRERAYQRISFEALNFSGDVKIKSGLTFNVMHETRQKCFWSEPRCNSEDNMLMLQARTSGSNQEVFAGAALNMPGDAVLTEAKSSVGFEMSIALEQGRASRVEKHAVILFDGSEGDLLWSRGKEALREAKEISFDDAAKEQADYWKAYWAVSDIAIEPGDDDEATVKAVAAEQQGIRFCSFQLAQTYNGGSMKHNIGAKGLTGEAYNGHAFWDTEACCLPFYLFTNPTAAKDLLLFRYNTLPMAKERAKMLDCRGACYPLATLNGDEACSLWQHASLQLQPSTAVAYGIWHYVKTTGDREFLTDYGAEMLIEISRFLESRVAVGNQTKKYGFYGVMGPDEFHLMVNNNAYTNYMGKRTLLFAAETLEELKTSDPGAYAALREKTGLTDEEIAQWQLIAENMYLPVGDDGLIEQHDGFFDLPHTDIDAIPVTDFPLYSHWSYDRIYRTDMIKQPDVLMMLYLYNSSFTEEIKRVNYNFYQAHTIHESSLSPAIHSILAAELGQMDEAIDFFGFATRLDLDDYNRNTREGLHITSIAMAWANIVYGFAGLRSDDSLLRFAPRLPHRWKKLSFSLTYRGRVISVTMERDKTVFCLREGEPLTVRIYDAEYQLSGNELKVAAEEVR